MCRTILFLRLQEVQLTVKNKSKNKSKNKNKNKSKNKLVNVETILEKHHALFVQHRSYFILGEFQWNGWE